MIDALLPPLVGSAARDAHRRHEPIFTILNIRRVECTAIGGGAI
jgi:hypothetical protein